MENDILYEKRLGLLLEDFKESENIKEIIEDKILPDLAKKDHILDIGAGTGNYTLSLNKYFKHSCIVEPNQIFCADLAKTLVSSGKIVTAYNGTWEDFETMEQKYDLILCMHVLYYVSGKEGITKAIQKMINSLASGGEIVIVMASEISSTTLPLFRLFSDDKMSANFAEDVAGCISKLGIPFELRSLENPIAIQTFEDFIELLAFFMCGQIEVEYIREKAVMINNEFKTENGDYQITQIAHMMTLSS